MGGIPESIGSETEKKFEMETEQKGKEGERGRLNGFSTKTLCFSRNVSFEIRRHCFFTPFSQVTMSSVLSSIVPLGMRNENSEYWRQKEGRGDRWREKNKS